MKLLRKALHIVLIVLTSFLALSAIAGGFALLANIIPMPVELLQGSLFMDYTVPGLALAAIVGGSAALAAILLLRNNRFAYLCAAAAGVIVMFFEFVEMLVIGSPAGVARMLQIVFFSLGTLIVIAAMGRWFLNVLTGPPDSFGV